MRKLASIQTIADLQPIPGADAIEKAKINEWWVVVKKGEFKVGDLCVYFEIDSFLPVKEPYLFLKRGSSTKKMLVDGAEVEGIRLKTIRLRGQISQGLALPLSSFPEAGTVEFSEGGDVSDILGVLKYEAPIPASLAGQVRGAFPGYIPRTDEERIQNCAYLLNPEISGLDTFYFTEKLDGTSATFAMRDGELHVCSRNLDLLETPGQTHWEMAKKYDLANSIPEGFAVQGEIIGEGIQKNPLKRTGHEFYAFNVFDITNHKYLDYGEFVNFCQARAIPLVPILKENVHLPLMAEDLLAEADGPSALCADAQREGFVVRPLAEKRVEIGGTLGRFSFKVISNAYLLDERD